MTGLMGVAAVAVFLGIVIGLAVVVTTATRTARQALRRRGQATLAPVRRRGRASRRRAAAGSAHRPRRYW